MQRGRRTERRMREESKVEGMSGEEGSSSPNIVTIVKRSWALHVARTRKKKVACSVGGET